MGPGDPFGAPRQHGEQQAGVQDVLVGVEKMLASRQVAAGFALGIGFGVVAVTLGLAAAAVVLGCGVLFAAAAALFGVLRTRRGRLGQAWDALFREDNSIR